MLLHYSPIEATVEGEPKEIYPYLGSSRLEEPLTRYPVDAVFHGHAHHGTAEGRTRTGVPVYNVSMHLLQREQPDGPLFRFLDLPGRRRHPRLITRRRAAPSRPARPAPSWREGRAPPRARRP